MNDIDKIVFSWAVVNMDSQYQKTVLVTRWRWYAAWWAASLRIFDGDDMKIVRTRQTGSLQKRV